MATPNTIAVKVTGTGGRQVMAGVRVYSKEIRNFRPFFSDVEKTMRVHMRRLYASEGGSAGRPWPSLEERYAARKAQEVGPKKILKFSSRMFQGMTRKSHPNALRERRRDSLVYGVKGLGYPGFHAGGTVTMAQRRPMDWDEASFSRDIQDDQRRHHNRTIRRAGMTSRRKSGDARGRIPRP